MRISVEWSQKNVFFRDFRVTGKLTETSCIAVRFISIFFRIYPDMYCNCKCAWTNNFQELFCLFLFQNIVNRTKSVSLWRAYIIFWWHFFRCSLPRLWNECVLTAAISWTMWSLTSHTTQSFVLLLFFDFQFQLDVIENREDD